MGRSQAGREGELGACLGIIEFDVGGWIGGGMGERQNCDLPVNQTRRNLHLDESLELSA